MKKDGELVIAFMNWLPKEDFITEKSLGLVKKYNPNWEAFNDRNPIVVPKWCERNFRMTTFYSYDEYIPFTYESWNGRIKASRGVGASLSEEEVQTFSNEHLELLKSIIDDNFSILHEITIMKFKKI